MGKSLLIGGFVALLLGASSCATSSPAPSPSTSAEPGASPSLDTPTSDFEILPLDPGDASEPALAFGSDGTLAIVAGAFEHASWPGFHTKVWVGGTSGPAGRGAISAFEHPRFRAIPSRDSDVEFSAAGTLHLTTNVRLYDPSLESPPEGQPPAWAISATRCPNAASPEFQADDCTAQLIDEAPTSGGQLDRPWILADGNDVWIAYHAANVIRIQHSTDDGMTWDMAGTLEPANASGDAFDNWLGPLAVDLATRDLVLVYVTAGMLSGIPSDNEVIVARTPDGGGTWEQALVHRGGTGERLWNVFPALAIDPETGAWHAAWSSGGTVFASRSADGHAWSEPQRVSTAPAQVALFPWLAARDGVVNLVYYGTDSLVASADNPWHVFMAASQDGGATFAQELVNAAPNHIGFVCANGDECNIATRVLLEVIEIAINPETGKVAIAFVDSTRETTNSGDPLPQIVLAVEH